MRLKVAVTGGICTGKSVVARALAEALGLEVVSLDEVARGALEKGSEGYQRVLDAFGPSVLDPRGEIDRRALGRLVFGDPEKRRVLEEIVHPLVEKEMARRIEALGGRAVIEAPLLVEKGSQGEMDVVIVVFCSPQRQLERLMARDGLTPAEAADRIRAQLPLEQKVAWAHYVVNNDFDLAYTEEQVRRISADIMKKAQGGWRWRP